MNSTDTMTDVSKAQMKVLSQMEEMVVDTFNRYVDQLTLYMYMYMMYTSDSGLVIQFRLNRVCFYH